MEGQDSFPEEIAIKLRHEAWIRVGSGKIYFLGSG